MNTIKIEHGAVKMIAHRGVSGIEKENTASAFVAAGNRSYYGIETDIHLTSDGQFIVIHNDTTGASCGVDLRVEETPYDALRNLAVLDRDGTFSRSDLRLPTLTEYINICKKYEKTAVLEFKLPMPEFAIRTAVEIVDELGYLDHTVFISFSLDNLTTLRKFMPDAPAQYLVDEWHDDLPDILAKYHLGLDVYHGLLNAERVAECKKRGITINVWTVDDPGVAAQMIALGVDMITTNILE